MPDYSLIYRQKFLKEQRGLPRRLSILCKSTADEMAALINDPNTIFVRGYDFTSAKALNKKIATIFATFHVKALRLTENEIIKVWNLSNSKNDAILDAYLRELATAAVVKDASKLYAVNRGVMDSFIRRTRGTETLSESIWRIGTQLRYEKIGRAHV